MRGHNYFLSQNPYVLNSYAGFGEAYYNVYAGSEADRRPALDRRSEAFRRYPERTLTSGRAIQSPAPSISNGTKWTGRFDVNWTPKLDFTDQTMIYGSYAHGYKAGGANPPGAVCLCLRHMVGIDVIPVHPLTFEPEFIDAYELGTKNTLLDGALTLNGDVFYYNYKGYQISEIVDRTPINLNFDATSQGRGTEATWEPFPA